MRANVNFLIYRYVDGVDEYQNSDGKKKKINLLRDGFFFFIDFFYKYKQVSAHNNQVNIKESRHANIA